jgi:hypothetical protein
MSALHSTLASALADRCAANATRIRELAAPLTDAQFWQKPFPFGNSFGHLVLHLTGNLNYYIGAQIANTEYVRDRPHEFSEANFPSKEETLRSFDAAIEIVARTLREQFPEDWSKKYSAVGVAAANRLAIFLDCESHMRLHIGQMIYLGFELQRQAQTNA